MTETENYIHVFGEEWRVVITSALKWLDEQEPKWNLSKPINRYGFLNDMIMRAQTYK